MWPNACGGTFIRPAPVVMSLKEETQPVQPIAFLTTDVHA